MVQSRLWRHRGRRELEAALVAGGRPKLFIIDYYHSDFHSGQDNHRLSKCQLVLTDDGAAGPGGTTSDPTAVAFACAFRHIVMISSAFGFARRAGACACLEAAAVHTPARSYRAGLPECSNRWVHSVRRRAEPRMRLNAPSPPRRVPVPQAGVQGGRFRLLCQYARRSPALTPPTARPRDRIT